MGNGVRLFKVRTAVQYNSRATGQILLFVMAILTCRYCRDPLRKHASAGLQECATQYGSPMGDFTSVELQKVIDD